ncbi:catechol 2,3-dioxygenase-like lactoylglutathione lyase family enzyme [Saccharopolyspora lacisalsi]|uniref:Catechol 2,3-dioxygenase-like lactoylglutathione lyase family enzyme n=1 Tax=Halosaccharopolyspora lacisalsi TaxID=1000566 RepID=A0A839E399_9PSEU|nr:VOC family protein [Halosaccharopolyspora lacisalsi]MBA8826217.1 catechol 2,3-dioxygenase-like lactoylglutathione lyase family enzyme [Halosaccharopolyspora lacisalsi]
MTSRIAVLGIDAVEPEVVARFWCRVLDWTVVERSAGGGVSIGPVGGARPEIDVLPVPEHKAVKNRMHLDVRAEDVSTAAELERLFALGARRADVGQAAGADQVVLADPEGNEFCLLSRSVQNPDDSEKPPP